MEFFWRYREFFLGECVLRSAIGACTTPRRKRKFPYRKVEELEEEIAELEAMVAKLQSDLSRPDVLRDGRLTKQTLNEFAAVKSQLAQLYEHWEEASELN